MLHRAYAEAGDLVTRWRLRYSLPRNDPRVLEATEEEVLYDLLVVRYYDAMIDEVLHPSSVEAGDPTAPARYEAKVAKLLNDAKFLEQVKNAAGGGRTKEKPRGPIKIRLAPRSLG